MYLHTDEFFDHTSTIAHKSFNDGLKPVRALGLCLGASTISIVQIESNGHKGDMGHAAQPKVVAHFLHPHEGDPRQTLNKALEQFDLKTFDRIAATGRNLRKAVNLASIPEPEAVELAYCFVKPRGVACPAIVSAGGETFMVYTLNRIEKIANVITGNKCASGTGEFFLQQLRRMDVTLDEASAWAATEEPYHVSGRCSVFCKSDCTHATNKGVPKSRVTSGLCKMMAEKILELLKNIPRRDIMVVGGSAQNRMMIGYLQKEIQNVIVPQEAPYFEALGAALWALEKPEARLPEQAELIRHDATSFDTLPELKTYEDQVVFKAVARQTALSGDVCVIGLDVGSTTTKAVLLRQADDAVLASVYLRTNGDPVGASRKCYAALFEQVKKTCDPSILHITGLGVTGSGRKIAGLHGLTKGIINEIIAHSTAAVHFDPQVDTIFEIGGQDAKYTYISNGVPSDYAMNEACSAGTGSFLEESAFETLGLDMKDIAGVALKGRRPPNFNDQCAAFIASDIKTAIHEGIPHEDIVAGLVYSICMNYTNRVKGNRMVGDKVFMQGGVCYNAAVPIAMASLVGKPIVVPPEPGLMGAFGVALEVKKRMATGLMAPQQFDLSVLMKREVKYGKSFVCKGGRDKCDRHCEIAVIELENKKYPFGGACNRYYNLRNKINYDVERSDLVKQRQHLVFDKYPYKDSPLSLSREKTEDNDCRPRKKVGINRSFLVNTYYPLYATFFEELGFETVLPASPAKAGIDRKNASFCHPAELAHGFFYSLINMDNLPEFIFLPHFKAIPTLNSTNSSQVCPLVQGETFYLQATFQKEIDQLKKNGTKVLTPLLDLTEGLDSAETPLIQMAAQMGANREQAKTAFGKALVRQAACTHEMHAIGQNAMQELEADPQKIAIVILGRPYSGFAEEAHMGIPHKLASRGVMVIPMDFLPLEDWEDKRHMYWGMGQRILRAARMVKKHPQLFGTFITNFSCGPDSFVVGYFRDIIGRKPSLTLELDSHTADAGLETRIEAFLDIVSAYRQLVSKHKKIVARPDFIPARTTIENGVTKVVASSGEALPLNHPRVKHLVPSMGRLSGEAMAAAFRGRGFHMVSHPPADEMVLKLGRANTSCKECLPLVLTTGALLNYIENHKQENEVLVYYMATASGPCRFGQYAIFMEDLIRKKKIPDVALFSLTSENGYGGLGHQFDRWLWRAIIISDVMEDIRSMLLVNARHPDTALRLFEQEWRLIVDHLEGTRFGALKKQLTSSAARLRTIELKQPPQDVPTILLTGEIFVRRDGLSRQNLTEHLADKGFAVTCSPIAEWVHYSQYLVKEGLTHTSMNLRERLAFLLRNKFVTHDEKRIKAILSQAGLVQAEPLDISAIIEAGRQYISVNMTGEAILTVGGSLVDVAQHVSGVIAIGPFGCMPNRVSEAILSTAMTRKGKLATDPANTAIHSILADVEDLPFLAIETDGSPFPQLIQAKLEAFCLRAERLHVEMQKVNPVSADNEPIGSAPPVQASTSEMAAVPAH
ncbi:MAG: acyl-CoA dehydratase activase [Thermodesulfobacteriota bacterium]